MFIYMYTYTFKFKDAQLNFLNFLACPEISNRSGKFDHLSWAPFSQAKQKSLNKELNLKIYRILVFEETSRSFLL